MGGNADMARYAFIDSDTTDKPFTEDEWRQMLIARGYVSPYPALIERDIGNGRKLFWVSTSAQASILDDKLYIVEGYLARREPDGTSPKGFSFAFDLYPSDKTIKQGMIELLVKYESVLMQFKPSE